MFSLKWDICISIPPSPPHTRLRMQHRRGKGKNARAGRWGGELWTTDLTSRELSTVGHCEALSVLIPAFPAYGSGSQAPTPSWEDIGSWPWWLLGEGWSHFFGRVAPWWLAQHLCAYGFWIGLSGLSKIKIKRNMKFGGRCLRELLGVEEGRDGHHWNTSCTCVNSNNNKIR